MITDSFSMSSPPVITVESIAGPQKHLIDTCILTFSDVIMRDVLNSLACEKIAEIRTCRDHTPVYAFSWEGKKIGVFLCHVGAAMAGSDAVELNWLTGAEKFIVFGSCGCLSQEKTKGRLIVPTAAYRDEGMSYHYAPPGDYIAMPGAEKTAALFEMHHIPYIMGRVWTTDAFYRELRHQVALRKEEGCLAVEMEAAGLQAVCDFHGFSLYYFLMTGDVLDNPEWNEADLRAANHCLDNFQIALTLAKNV